MSSADRPPKVIPGNQDAGPARLVRSVLSSADGIAPSHRGKDVRDSLITLPELARQLVDADFGAVTVMDPGGNVTQMLYAGLTSEEADRIGSPPKGMGLLGRLGDRDAPLRIEHISAHQDSAGFPPGHPVMESLLGVRVTSGKGGIANLYVANLPGKPGFSEEDEDKVLALAAYARLALDNADLYEQERALRATAEAAEQRLTAVIQGSSAGVVVKDAHDGGLVQVSSEARRISRLEFNQLPGADQDQFEEIFYFPDGTKMAREDVPVNIALSQRVTVGPVELLFVRPDGSRVPVLVSAAPVFGAYGGLDSAICVFVDVTRLKEAEQAKDDFLSMVTHDLRTPLTTIKGMAAAALDAARASNTEGAIGFLAPIDDEVDYLTDLISNLLDMTRIEAGADVFQPEVCHMADVTQDSLARIGRSKEALGRAIHSNVPPDLPAVFADPAQIGRVMDNLLSNALKYSDDEIGIYAGVTGNAGHIRVAVEDRGPGIPPEYREAVFDRFARVRGAPRSGRQGSGLGLAICKSIITAHSGEIGVDSSAKGSVFWFTLPVDTGD